MKNPAKNLLFALMVVTTGVLILALPDLMESSLAATSIGIVVASMMILAIFYIYQRTSRSTAQGVGSVDGGVPAIMHRIGNDVGAKYVNETCDLHRTVSALTNMEEAGQSAIMSHIGYHKRRRDEFARNVEYYRNIRSEEYIQQNEKAFIEMIKRETRDYLLEDVINFHDTTTRIKRLGAALRCAREVSEDVMMMPYTPPMVSSFLDDLNAFDGWGDGININFQVVGQDTTKMSLLLVSYVKVDGTIEYSIMIIVANSISDADRNFIIMHEIGHFFLHILPIIRTCDNPDDVLTEIREFELNPVSVKARVEHDANLFSLIFFYPTSQLAIMKQLLQDSGRELEPEELVDWLESKIPEYFVDAKRSVRKRMIEFARLRLDDYLEYEKFSVNPMLKKLPSDSIEQDVVEYLMPFFSNEAWVRLDENQCILSLSDEYAKLLGVEEEALRGTNIKELLCIDTRPSFDAQWERRKQFKTGKYIVRHTVRGGEHVDTWLFSWPIKSGEQFRGAFVLLHEL